MLWAGNEAHLCCLLSQALAPCSSLTMLQLADLRGPRPNGMPSWVGSTYQVILGVPAVFAAAHVSKSMPCNSVACCNSMSLVFCGSVHLSQQYAPSLHFVHLTSPSLIVMTRLSNSGF